MTLQYAAAELIVAAIVMAFILRWDNNRLNEIEQRHRDRFKGPPTKKRRRGGGAPM